MSKAARTRQFIIDQTASLFNTKGYAGTSLHDLTAATGLTKGAIYGNFANKEEVAIAAFDHNLLLVREGIRSGVASSSSAAEKLRAMTRFYRQVYSQLAVAGGCPILNTAVETDDAPPTALRQRVQDSLRGWQRYLVRVIESGQHQGELQPAADPAHLATLFMALIEGGILLAKATGEAQALYTALDHIELLIDRELIG